MAQGVGGVVFRGLEGVLLFPFCLKGLFVVDMRGFFLLFLFCSKMLCCVLFWFGKNNGLVLSIFESLRSFVRCCWMVVYSSISFSCFRFGVPVCGGLFVYDTSHHCLYFFFPSSSFFFQTPQKRIHYTTLYCQNRTFFV